MTPPRWTNWMPHPDSAGFHQRSLWSVEKAVAAAGRPRSDATRSVATHARRSARMAISLESDRRVAPRASCTGTRPIRLRRRIAVVQWTRRDSGRDERWIALAPPSRPARRASGSLLEAQVLHPHESVGNRAQAGELARVRPQPVTVEEVDDRPVLQH